MQPLARVHPVERLVEQQHLRVVHQRGGDPGALPHALGVRADPAVLRVGSISTRSSARRAAASGSGSRCSFALASTNSLAR